LDNVISISTELATRYYTTNHTAESDPLHAERNDINYRFYLNYDYDIFKNFSTGIFINFIFRDADTNIEMNKEYVSYEKDYNQFQLGLNFNYKFQF
jgi:hypothetical protein